MSVEAIVCDNCDFIITQIISEYSCSMVYEIRKHSFFPLEISFPTLTFISIKIFKLIPEFV